MRVEIQGINSLFHNTEPWYIETCVFNEEKQHLDVLEPMVEVTKMIQNHYDGILQFV